MKVSVLFKDSKNITTKTAPGICVAAWDEIRASRLEVLDDVLGYEEKPLDHGPPLPSTRA